MQHTLKRLPKSTAELLIELSPDEMQPYLTRAATQLSEQSTIPGFRPGKAPYEQVVAKFGAGRIWEEAAQLAVPKIYGEIVTAEKLETIGSPEIAVEKLAPNNPFIFKATVALLPEITFGNYTALKLTPISVEISNIQVDKALTDLQKMQTKEVVVDRPANSAGDKVTLDMSISLDSVPLDGGVAKNHAVYMDEEYYIPGMREKLVGLKKGDTKEFQLKFPADHYQKMIAGRDVDFKIEIRDVFALTPPELDDAFAKTLGQKNMADLRVLIHTNLKTETDLKATQKMEIELLEKAVEKTRFGEIPDILINEETHKMLRELEDGIVQQGLVFADYLQKIHKTSEQLRLEFSPEALKRVKTSLLMRALATAQKITVRPEEIDAEVAQVLEVYKNEPEMHAQIRSENARQYLAGMLRNRKTIQWLMEQVKK